jgi:hypothetical protein
MFDELQESSFSPADWAEVTKLKLAFEQGGQDGLIEALTVLVHSNRTCYLNVMEVLNPGYAQGTENMAAQNSAAMEELKEEQAEKTD